MDDNLLCNTTEYFDSVNFSELNDGWLDEMIDNEFIDVEVNNISLSLLFADDAVQTLLNICDACNEWIKKSNNTDVPSTTDDVLWTFLNEMNVSVKQVHGLIYFLCSKAITSSTLQEKKIGLISAKFYFCSLRVPGSFSYSVYNSNLFRLCIDCLQMPDHNESKDTASKWKEFEVLLQYLVSAIKSLVPLLSISQLNTDTTVVDHIIWKLGELVAVECSKASLNFNLDFVSTPEIERQLRYNWSFVVTSLAYQGLASLINFNLDGKKEYIHSIILSSLSQHILCTKTKKSPIPSKFLIIKDNAVSFICHNLKDNNTLCSKVTSMFLRRLCLTVNDKADFRATVSQAVITVMFHLQIQDLVEFFNWLLQLSDASGMNNRVFAIDVLGLLLENMLQVDRKGLPESIELYLSPFPVIFVILTRCDDVCRSVQTKALSTLSRLMKCILGALMNKQNISNVPEENFGEDFEVSDVNGYHRSFWYSLTSFKDIMEEIGDLLHRHIEDGSGMARKSALQALESLICFNHEYLSEDNLKLFLFAAKDANIVMRKQMVQSLTSILASYPNNIEVHKYWLKCVLPLVQDPENTVQAKVLSVIEEKFLLNILSHRDDERDAAFCLLEKLGHGELFSYQRYLQKAFSCWKLDKKLRPQRVSNLDRCIGNGRDDVIWFYLCLFGAFCKLPPNLCQLAVTEFQKNENWKRFASMEYILKVLGSTFCDLLPEQLEVVRGILIKKLESFAAPVEILPLMIEILHKIETHLGKRNEFAEFADKMMQASMDTLTPFMSLMKVQNPSDEDLAIKSLAIVKEVCQIFYTGITQNLIIALKSFVFSKKDGDCSNIAASRKISVSLQAHAYASLGKISLQHEPLGKELLPLLAKELLTSKADVLRNNSALVLLELCKHYTYADQYLTLIYSCFKDDHYVIRYQSITLLVSLLQEGYVKCKGSLPYCLLSTVIDKHEAIQELGRYCLCTLLFDKRKSIFCESVFVRAVFIFNSFSPPHNEKLARIVKELDRFSLPDDQLREERMHIYKFMLENMDPSSCGVLITELCREILMPVAESVFPFNEVTKSMVRDCLAILSSEEIRAFGFSNANSELEEDEEEQVSKAELEIRKAILVQPVIPAMTSLKNLASLNKSDLLSDVVIFLKDILTDYESEIPTILESDQMLLKQVQFEMRNEANRLEKETKRKYKGIRNDRPLTSPLQSGQIAENAKEISAYLIRQGRHSVEGTESDRSSLRLVPQSSSLPNNGFK